MNFLPRIIAVELMLIALLSIVWAAQAFAVTGSLLDDGPPPAWYDHEFDGHLIVRYVSPETIYKPCNWRKLPGGALMACSDPQPERKLCIIYMSTTAPPEFLRHERAHCNGWPADHPR